MAEEEAYFFKTSKYVDRLMKFYDENPKFLVPESRTYDSFVEKFGEQGKRLLDALGIVKIPPNEVTLNPVLLGEKFKRHADRVILRKAGVIPPKNAEGQK